jgi:hypothetical protein
MPRKRKSTTQSTENPTPTETPTAVAEPPAIEAPAAEPKADGQSFADRIGQRKWTSAPDPFGIAKDNLAGVRLFESREDGQMAIKFGSGSPEDKPSQAVIDKMKEAGYRWNLADRVWTYPVRPDSAMSTRIDAEKLYQEVRQMIRQEKGIEATQDLPF